MKLEDQVVNIKIAKRLNELGVKHKSLFWWQELKNGDGHLIMDSTDSFSHICYAAFSVAELGEIMKKEMENSSYYEKEGWVCFSTPPGQPLMAPHHTNGATEADARGNMLISFYETALRASTKHN